MELPLTRRSLLAACGVFPTAAPAGYTTADELAGRRRRLAERVGKGVIAMVGYDRHEGRAGFTGFRQESNFRYLTGHDEPGAALLIAPRNGKSPYREVLFVPGRDAPSERWSGPRTEPGNAATLGFQDALDARRLRSELKSLLKGRGGLLGLYPRSDLADSTAPESTAWHRLKEISGGADLRDIRGPLAAMRAIKSPSEIALLRKAVQATERGFLAAWRMVGPGVEERSAAAEFVGAAFRAGCERLAFPTMAGSGRNATVLHYKRNRSVMRDGGLFLMDAGGEYGRYAADLARTVPVGGRFSPRQRQLYGIVLDAQRAAIAAARPGADLGGPGKRSLASIAERVLSAGAPRGVDTRLPHALGHHVGLDVHDPVPRGGGLAEGMVVTIEPGIYLPDEGVGIRVEDMIEITANGCRTMSRDLPSEPGAIERAIASSGPGPA